MRPIDILMSIQMKKTKIRECIVFQKHIQKMNIHCMKEIHILLTSILNICAMIFHRHTET